MRFSIYNASGFVLHLFPCDSHHSVATAVMASRQPSLPMKEPKSDPLNLVESLPCDNLSALLKVTVAEPVRRNPGLGKRRLRESEPCPNRKLGGHIYYYNRAEIDTPEMRHVQGVQNILRTFRGCVGQHRRLRNSCGNCHYGG